MVFERCYPKVTDWIYFTSHETIDLRFLPVFSYGFWVAVGFMAAAIVINRELKRREQLGLFTYTEKIIEHNNKFNILSVLLFAVGGFVIGWKLGPMVISSIDSIWVGVLLSVVLVSMKLYEYSQRRNMEPYQETLRVFPSDLVGDFVVICAIFGVLGSNLFNFLESPDDYATFWNDPMGSIFSGLSVYGGMICAGIALLVYCYWKKINVPNMFDCLAYCFILANGLGRMGCQMSGDGDWGLVNPHVKPAFIPQFLWSSQYAHNIADVGVPIEGCIEQHCMILAQAVYPTPIYELLMCLAIFFILHFLRKRLTAMPGMLFFIFFILIGIQRYTVEQIRDLGGRDLYHVFGMALKQSELISIVLVIVGVLACGWTWFYYNKIVRKPEVG